LDVPAQVVLTNAVELKRLARRQPQRPVGVFARQTIECEPLWRGADPPRQAHAHHELVARLELRAAPLVAQIAIVLLVNAEELRE
jgi:hypothetical protein